MKSIKKLLKFICCRSHRDHVNLVKREEKKIPMKIDIENYFIIENIKFYPLNNILPLPQIIPYKEALRSGSFYSGMEKTDGHKNESAYKNKPIFIENVLPKQFVEKPTLVIDLDLTLVYSSITPMKEYDFTIEVTKDKSSSTKIYFLKRPYLLQFLSELSEFYEIIIFSAAIMEYTIKTIKNIDPEGKYVYAVLGRTYCQAFTQGGVSKDLFVKNLSILGRNMKRTLLIDDKEYSFIMNPENGQIVSKFTGSKNDQSLLPLKHYLISISSMEDFTKRDPFHSK